MATNNDIKDLFARYIKIDHEIKLLQDDRKQLLQEFKDRIDPAAFQSALRSAKIKSKVKPESKDDFDRILEIIEKSITLESLN